MKKLILKSLIFAIFISLSQKSFTQVPTWENYNVMNTNLQSFRNGALGTDAVHDNYGLHMAVICQGENPCFSTLNYYHFDNSGNKLDSIRALESDILGACIGSNNGKVYIVAYKNGVFKIYERINGVSDLQFKLSYDPPNYGTVSSNDYFVNMSMTFIGEKMYLVWDRIGYSTGSFSYNGAVGFAEYNPAENVMTAYLPINHFEFGEFGRLLMFPKMISSNNKLHIVCNYARPGSLIDTMFITKDISFDGQGNPIYEPLKGVLNWGIHSPNVSYFQSEQTRANIISTGNELYVVASLSYLNNLGEISIDTKFKHKSIIGNWDNDFLEVISNGKNFFKAPSISYNTVLNRVGFAFSAYISLAYHGIFREFDISSGNLLSSQFIIPPLSTNLIAGWIGKSIHGEYLVMNTHDVSAAYYEVRRPADISGEITNNTLLTGNEYFNAPTPPYCRTNGADIEALAFSTTRIKENTRVFIDEDDLIIFRANSCLIYEPNSEIFPSDRLIYETNCITWQNLACNRTYPGGSIKFSNELSYTVDNGGFIVIDSNSTLEIADNTNLIFDGSNSYLKLIPNSNIKMGTNSSIKFINGAYLNSNGSNISGINSTSLSNGIILENSGIDSIVNCTFSNAKTAISITNTSGTYANRVIKNNNFNIPAGGDHKGIYGENNYKILIQNNTFNMPVNPQNVNYYYSGIFLKNSIPNGEPESAGQTEEEETPTPYSLNIINNTFKNDSGSIILANCLSNVLPYYVKGNSFDSASSLGILGLKITGTIKDNMSSDFATALGIHLVNSSPNLYNNIIISRDVSLHLIGNSYPNLSPYIYGNQMTWSGGKNRLTTQNFDNIQLTHPANVYTDFGENRFAIFDTASAYHSYHIYGWLESTISKYGGRNNCWYPGNTAKIYLRHTNSGYPVNTITGVTTIDCDHEIDPNGWSVDYLGNGIYDSVKQSVNNTGNVPTEADLIYEQAYNYFNNTLYLDAIGSFKDLIDTYNEYENLPKSSLDLYNCYLYLDTSLTQSERNTLFGNLKIYAEAKINSGIYKNDEFLDNCFDIITMCEAKMENYDAAANNYEFIPPRRTISS